LDPQPGINTTFAGNATIRNATKRIKLPENGKKGNLKAGCIFM
jgi:hypothetical protein